MSETNEAFAYIVDSNGNKVGLNAEELGRFVIENYATYDFMFKQNFFDYQDTHAMAPIRAKLKEGLDAVSCDYIDRFEYLLNFQRVSDQALIKSDMFWTETDKALLERNREIVASWQIPLLQQVNQDFSTAYTNLYGMYEVLGLAKKSTSGVSSYEQEELSYMEFINGKVVIDAGGFIGDTVVLFKDIFEKSKIFSFEPVKKNYDFLCNFVKPFIENGQVVPVQKGLGSQKGTLRFSGTRAEAAADATASSYYDYANPELYEEAEVVTIDDYAKEHGLEVGLIKVDVEGAEVDIIKGALNTIKTYKPLLVIAIYHNAAEFYELKPYLESLNLGYKFCIRRSNICVPSTDLVLVAYQD